MQLRERSLEFTNVQKEQLPTIAQELLKHTKEIKVWLFMGEMGTGKTTLIKEVCKQLNVIDPMSSPTYSIVNEYWTHDRKKVYHFDFYRTKTEAEAAGIGADEYFHSGSYCFVEWPDHIQSILPDQYAIVTIETTEKYYRTISLTIHGQ